MKKYLFAGIITPFTAFALVFILQGPPEVQVEASIESEDSILNGSGSGLVQIRFEDYVSNPQPGEGSPVDGWVAQYAVPFKGLVQPLAANTTRSPLPPSVGMLIESSTDSVGFYDPSLSVAAAEPGGDKLLFRFVDPDDILYAATVSHVAFHVVGSSVSRGEVSCSVYDVDGNLLYSCDLPGGDPYTTIDFVARLDDGQPVSAIHKVVVEHSGTGYFVTGNVLWPSQADFAFDGHVVSTQLVHRPIGEQIPYPHSERWQQHQDYELITDMTQCTPAGVLSNHWDRGKWKIYEYETAGFSGKCLAVMGDSTAPDITLNTGWSGWHAVYIGLSSSLEVRLDSDPHYTRLSNRLGVASSHGEELEEVFLGVADLTGNQLRFSPLYRKPGRVHYVKAIPLTAEEVTAIQADRAQQESKNLIATFDGFNWISTYGAKTRSDLAASFSAYRDSDFKTWWFQTGGADLVHHPTVAGTLMGGDTDAFAQTEDLDYSESLAYLHAQGIDPLRVAVEEAHAQDAEIIVCLRAGAWKAAPPLEEYFQSAFYEAHPEWRCVDIDGTETMYMSYAAEEVQDHLIDVYREALERGADGVGFLFHRGMPMMLWEEPFRQRFAARYGLDPRNLAEDDSRVYAMRAEIVSGFIQKIRNLLDEVEAERGDGQQLKLAVSTFATEADNEKFGLDVERWIEEELIDQIGIAWFANHTSGISTQSVDTEYYARITEGTDVKIHPFVSGSRLSSAAQLLQDAVDHYDQGADGIAVWNPNQFEGWISSTAGRNPYWPLVSKLGHRDQIRDGSLLYAPVRVPLTRLGENRYSRWFPNTGF